MKYLNCVKIDKKILIPVLGGTIMLIYLYFIDYLPKYEIISQNPFLMNICTSIGMIFAFIPYIIVKYRTKKTMINDNLNKFKGVAKFNLNLIHFDIIKKTRFNRYKFIFILSIFDFLQTLLYNFCTMRCIYNLWIFDILFISLFSNIILKIRIYKHQYISIIIIIILGFGLNIIQYWKLDTEGNTLDAFEISMKFIKEIFFSLITVISKYNMEKNYCSPYEICIWDGVITLIFNMICLLIMNLLGVTVFDIKYPDNFIEYFNNYDINDFFLSLIMIFDSFIYNVLFFLTCDYFSPFHIIISIIIEECYNYFQIEEKMVLNILGILILILITFMFLIFIEVIEINIFDISYNTKRNIEIRAKQESFTEFINLLDPNDIKEARSESSSINSSISNNSD